MALYGPARGVMFLQHHQPGVVLEHRLFHFRLPYSSRCHVEVIHGGESFVALAEALQNALETCGGVPAVFRHEGVRFVACPASRQGRGGRKVQCISCGGRFGIPLCARADRPFVITFPVHVPRAAAAAAHWDRSRRCAAIGAESVVNLSLARSPFCRTTPQAAF